MIAPRNQSQCGGQRERISNGIGDEGALSQVAPGRLKVAIGDGRASETEEATRHATPVADATEPVEEPDELRSARCVACAELVEAGAKELCMQQLVVIPGPLRQLVGFGKPSLRFIK